MSIPTVPVTRRIPKGSKLTWEELDANFTEIIRALGIMWGRTRSLYDYPGHTVGGNCIAAMNAALADPNCDTIIVPDGVTLGSHTFDSPRKTIVGGRNVNFSGNGAGIYPRVCDFVRITGFRDAVLPTFPMSGGVAANGATFVATPTGHNIGTIIIDNNTTSGGKNGLAIGPEGGSGQIRHTVVITQNVLANLNGVDAGTGYGIQYANELLTGMCYIANNIVSKSSRVGIYIARNTGASPVYLQNNIVIDHRINATNKGDGPFCAFDIVRASNVHGSGNQSIRPFDGSLLIGPEFEAPALLNSKNISWENFTIDSPANTVPQIFCGYLDDPIGARLEGVEFRGINYTSLRPAPLFDYYYGKRVTVRDVFCRYIGISSGAYYPFILKGRDAIDTVEKGPADSGDLRIENVRVVGEGNTGASFHVFELAGTILTADLKLVVKNISYEVDSLPVNRKFWNPQAAVSNTRIEPYECGTTGMVWATGVSWRRGSNPAIQNIDKLQNVGFFTPDGQVTPDYVGQLLLATDSFTVWAAGDSTNSKWICIGRLGAGTNDFGSTVSSKVVAEGFAISTTSAEFTLDAVGNGLPSSITLTGTTTYRVAEVDGTTVGSGTGKTPTINLAASSKCKTIITVTGITGVTKGQPLRLYSEGSCNIRVNY